MSCRTEVIDSCALHLLLLSPHNYLVQIEEYLPTGFCLSYDKCHASEAA